MASAEAHTPRDEPAAEKTHVTQALVVLAPPPSSRHEIPDTFDWRAKAQQMRNYYGLVMGDRTTPVQRVPREWKTLPDSPYEFTIKQYNVLAEGLSSGGADCARRHYGDPRAVNRFGGFNCVKYPDACLAFDNRKWLLLEEILDHGPDVITLQEVDHYHSFFKPQLSRAGYDSCFEAKVDSPCIPLGFYSDGCAIFWKRGSFTALDGGRMSGRYKSRLQDGQYEGQVYLVQGLYHIPSGRACVVGTTHLKSKSSVFNEGRRAEQVRQFLAAIQVQRSKYANCPAVFGADLNADAYTVGDVIPSCIRQVATWGVTGTPEYASAYPMPVKSVKDMFTTWKKRGTAESKHTIDYIWHTVDGLRLITVLEGVPSELMPPERMPSMQFPSDHLPIMAKLSFDSRSAV
jgi:nocturnin